MSLRFCSGCRILGEIIYNIFENYSYSFKIFNLVKFDYLKKIFRMVNLLND